MVDWKIEIHIRNIELVIFSCLTVIYTLAIIIQPDSQIYLFLANFSAQLRIFSTKSTYFLLMAFLISLGGNSTVLIVVPYTLVIYLLSYQNPTQWVWISLMAGLGAGLGEVVSYYVGRLIGASKKVQQSEIGEKFHRMKLQFEKNPTIVPLTVFIFALTPLPDDIILVPMGLMKYKYYKAILPCIIGKTILCGIICWIGSMIRKAALNDLIENHPILGFLRLFVPSDVVNPRADLITFSMIFIFIYFIAKVDFDKWSKRLSKDRRHFETLLLEGGNYSIDFLVERFEVVNVEKFRTFLLDFITHHENIKIKDDNTHFDQLVDTKEAYHQSLEFVEFFFSAASEKPSEILEEATEKIASKEDRKKRIHRKRIEKSESSEKEAKEANPAKKKQKKRIYRKIIGIREYFGRRSKKENATKEEEKSED